MKHVDLFSGIGGFALAAQRVWGKEYNPVVFCEINSFCARILKKNWPGIEIVRNVKWLKKQWLRAGFHVKTCLSETPKESESMAVVVAFGKRCVKLLGFYDRITQSWKTSPACENGSVSYSGTWPRSGIMHNGTAYQLQALVPHTEGIGCGLLPTPRASQDYKPIRCMAPSEKNCTHGVQLVAWIGTKFPHLIGSYLTGGLLGAMMGYPENWHVLPMEMPLFPKLQN